MRRVRTRTQVAIVGGGPAGLMLSHLLHRSGIESIVIDNRSVETIEQTHRAGILEPGSVAMLVDEGVSDRVLREGHEHRGIDLRVDGVSHRIDFQHLAGGSTWLYPQTDVFIDLHAARIRDQGQLLYGIGDTMVDGIADQPVVSVIDADEVKHEIRAELVVGADGSRSSCRALVPDATTYAAEYPFAWLGVLVQAPPSAEELIYARSERGFALISQRTERVQRMYLQCAPGAKVEDWSDDRIWDELQRRVTGGDGYSLKEGPIVEKVVLPFRSFVQTPMRAGKLLLAGDAAHTVPPTGAKGLNLALADVRLLAELIDRALNSDDHDALASYTERALDRVWRAQHFSVWMTQMLHRSTGSAFDQFRTRAELRTVLDSEAGRTYLAEGYLGWPTS